MIPKTLFILSIIIALLVTIPIVCKFNASVKSTAGWTHDYPTSEYDVKLSATNLFKFADIEPSIPFLTISNRPYIRCFNTVLFKFTDEEWTLITNHYRQYLTTNVFTFMD